MVEASLQAVLRERMNLRIGREMAAYLLRELGRNPSAAIDGEIQVIAADARTGWPVRTRVSRTALRALLSANGSPAGRLHA